MKENLKPTQKEKNLFFANANMGIVTSLLAGLVGASFYDLVNFLEFPWILRAIYSIVFTAILILIMFFFKSKIKKLKK